MTDDDLERLDAEQLRRGVVLSEARKAVRDAEASGDPDAIAEAEEAVRRAGMAVAELAIGDTVRDRMTREIAHLDNQPDNPETDKRRKLTMLGRCLIDLRSLGIPDLADVAAADTLRQINGVEGQLLSPVKTGPGWKGFDEVDLNLIRRYVLRVFVECARTGKDQECFLKQQPKGPTYTQFREWSQRVPLDEREMATTIGEAPSAGRPLSSDQAALWALIEHDDLVEMFGYVQRLDPKTVLAARRA